MQEQQAQTTSTLKLRILSYATELFFRLGVRSVTMDEIAQGMGISKKTLYQLFKNKAEIVKEVSLAFCKQNEAEAQAMIQSSENAIVELFRVIEHIAQTGKSFAPNLIFEIRKYYPESWQLFQKHESHVVVRHIKDNLARGKKEGLYRANINPDILARMHLATMEAMLNERLFPMKKFPFLEVQLQMMEMYIRGIATGKGLEITNTFFSKFYNNSSTHPQDTEN